MKKLFMLLAVCLVATQVNGQITYPGIGVDAREIIQDEIDAVLLAGGGTVIIPGDPNGDERIYSTGQLEIIDFNPTKDSTKHITLELEEGVVLEAISTDISKLYPQNTEIDIKNYRKYFHNYPDPDIIGQTKLNGNSIFLLYESNNVTIKGNKNSKIRLLKHEYTDGEYRNCISIRKSTDINIEQLNLVDSGGDGIYIGSTSTSSGPSDDIDITNITFDNNARQGISIVAGKNVTITNCEFKNTGQNNPDGVASNGPWAGIDLEPNGDIDTIQDVTIKKCVFENNRFGILFDLNLYTPAATTLGSITIEDIYVKSTHRNGIAIVNSEEQKGTINISKAVIEGTNESPIALKDLRTPNTFTTTDLKVIFNDCIIDNNSSHNPPVSFALEYKNSDNNNYGNVEFNHLQVIKNNSLNFMQIDRPNNEGSTNRITGNIISFEDKNAIKIINIDEIGTLMDDTENHVVTGDFNDDDLTDYFIAGKTNSTTNTSWKALYLSTGNDYGDFKIGFIGKEPNIGGLELFDTVYNSVDSKIYSGDFNGDGKTDLFINGTGTYRALYLANTNGTGFIKSFAGDQDASSNIPINETGNLDNETFFTDANTKIFIGNFNASSTDKNDDILIINSSTRALYLGQNDGTFLRAFLDETATDNSGGLQYNSNLIYNDTRIYLGDYNGDGKQDLFINGKNQYIALYIGKHVGAKYFEEKFASNSVTNQGIGNDYFLTNANSKVIQGDYDNNGTTDLLVIGYEDTTHDPTKITQALYWGISNNPNQAFWRRFRSDLPNNSNGGIPDEPIILKPETIISTGDFNGDQKTDILFKCYNNVDQQGGFRAIYIANNDGKSFHEFYKGNIDDNIIDSEQFFTDSNAKIYVGNYNNDNKSDLLVKGYNNQELMYLSEIETNSNISTGKFNRIKQHSTDISLNETNRYNGISTDITFSDPISKKTTTVVGNFDRVGGDDIFVKGFNTWRSMYLNESTATETKFNRVFSGSEHGLGGLTNANYFTHEDAKIYPGDFNGDGLTDFFTKGHNTDRSLFLSRELNPIDPNDPNSVIDNNVFDYIFSGGGDGVGGTDSESYFTDTTGKIVVGDFNGDGYDDLFVYGYRYDSSLNTWISARALYTFDNNNQDFNREFLDNNYDPDYSGGTDDDVFSSSNTKVIVGNFDGNQSLDLFVYTYDDSDPNDIKNIRALYTANSNGDGFDIQFKDVGNDNILTTAVNDEVTYHGLFDSTDTKVYTGNFDGDTNNLTDLFINGTGKYRGLYLGDSSGLKAEFASSVADVRGTEDEPYFTDKDAKFVVGDYNADGYSDLFVHYYNDDDSSNIINIRALYTAYTLPNGINYGFYLKFRDEGTINTVNPNNTTGSVTNQVHFASNDVVVYPGNFDNDSNNQTDLLVKGINTESAIYTASTTGDSFDEAIYLNKDNPYDSGLDMHQWFNYNEQVPEIPQSSYRPSSIEEEEELITTNDDSAIYVYPNPFLTNIEINNKEIDFIEVYDSVGKLMFRGNIDPNQIDLSFLNHGIYIIKLIDSETGFNESVFVAKQN